MKKPFSAFRSQGYQPLCYHERTVAGRPAQVGYLTGRRLPPIYAVRYHMRQAHGATLREAVANLRLLLPTHLN